ncbi:ubiquinone biosynthesis accessory factor UbiJ [Cellvibrio polysaccharolyticus]|uniref:Ubiquinone biosynthesis accessory factor UbiJ n=1 Tax=Cellvibrio polysaccharolyticus TaxID=2082724 RepID=A0A928V4W0_9GAMM|nr:SCP2 sterol-binding domain-containing protein [Cellvibrio polysaccharolyticus]MBE8718846.1 hypothetical protein [Cellvibrio polysaccharolyticus]
MDGTLKTAGLVSLETLINKALQYDPGTRLALAQLQGQVLAVQVSQPAFTVYVQADSDGLRLNGYYEGDVTTRLRGSLPALMKLARSSRTSFADTGVEVIGNTAALITWQNLLRNLDIDWEEALSGVLGDIAGPKLAAGLRQLVSYSTGRSSGVTRLTGEYLTEELRLLPSRQELDVFYEDVDEVRLHLDRLEARLQRLQQNRPS